MSTRCGHCAAYAHCRWALSVCVSNSTTAVWKIKEQVASLDSYNCTPHIFACSIMYIIAHISAQLSALKAVPMVENALTLECASAPGIGKGIVVLLVSLVPGLYTVCGCPCGMRLCGICMSL